MLVSNGKLGVAIIGCGDMGNVHSQAYGKMDGVEIVAYSDIDAGRAKALSEKYCVPFWTTKNAEAYNRPDVDIVSVCIPSSEHSSVVMPALELGKHVVSEKSIARTVEDGERVAAAVREANRRGLKYTISFQRRWQPIRQKQAELLRGGIIGSPVMMQTSFLAHIRPKIAMHGMWDNGGPAIDMGVHQYDYWRTQFNAEPVQVIARGFTYGIDRPELASVEEKAPDTVTAIVTHDSGDIGVVTFCWGLPPGWKGKDTPELIVGPKGTITHNGQTIVISGEGGKVERVDTVDIDEKSAFLSDFVASICEDKQPRIQPVDGLAALHVGVAVLESLAKGGQPIALDPRQWLKWA